MNCTAFQVTADDVQIVLEAYALRVSDTQGKSFGTMASELIDEIDAERVEKAALASGTELTDQTMGAFGEIKVILVEMNVLEF